ncbi:hypothetical protein J0H58_19990 [bacterium]|nr:hypothetical protein [bacterium]
MPELIVSRKAVAPSPMVCMYCGAPATTAHEWREANRRPERGGGGGGDVVPVPGGDDPVSAVVGLLLFPLVLWELVKAIGAAVVAVARYFTRPATPPAPKPAPPKDPPTTRVVVTTCDRHRRFRARFVWAGAATAVALVALWAWAVVVTRRTMGTDDTGLAVTLILTAVLSTVLLPVAISFWYALAGPVIVDRVTESTVVLDRVRQAYFDATGQTPNVAA